MLTNESKFDIRFLGFRFSFLNKFPFWIVHLTPYSKIQIEINFFYSFLTYHRILRNKIIDCSISNAFITSKIWNLLLQNILNSSGNINGSTCLPNRIEEIAITRISLGHTCFIHQHLLIGTHSWNSDVQFMPILSIDNNPHFH